MHELGIAQEIIAAVGEASGGARVARVVVEVGRLQAVVPDALRFCFDLACEGTVLEGAALDIVEVPGRARCRACGSESAFDQPWGLCGCGSGDLEWLSGSELVIKAMEVG
jgi:hydrogenase nickel incorporation protein HypA/HybF